MQTVVVSRTVQGWLSNLAGFTTYLNLALLALFLGGCAAAPKQQEGPIFYPPLPNPPRIQYLKTFSTERDLAGDSGFGDFILGKEAGGENLISKPYGVAVADGKIFAVDTRGPSYVIFDLKTKKVKTVYGDGAV